MKNFHIKSILLGIGIGIIFTSFTSLVFVAGMKPESKLAKEEVIELAKKYGMVDGTKLINKDAEPVKEVSKPTEAAIIQKKASPTVIESTPIPTLSNTPIPTEAVKKTEDVEIPQASGELIAVSVNPGDVSEIIAKRLKNLGLINDAAGFLNEMKGLGLESAILVGDYKIRKGADNREIIKVLTRK